MTLPSNFDRGELRYIDQGSTRSTGFTAADNAAWAAGTAVKLRAHGVDLSGLSEEVVEDSAMQTAFEGNPPSFEARRFGNFKYRMWLEGGSADATADTVAALLGSDAVLGGLKDPGAITDAAEAACSATNITATTHGMDENEMVLFGVRGDEGGDGRVGVIEDATTSADAYDLQLALPAAPAESAVLKNGHTIFLDWEAEGYHDYLFIGSHVGSGAADDPDQVQMIGCACSAITFGGLGKGEKAWVELEMQVAEWQWVNYADQATLSHATAAEGKDPVPNAAGGSFVIQDAGTTTRNAIAGDEIEIVIPLQLRQITDHNYSNSIGGWVKVKPPAGEGPSIKIKAYWAILADMPGLFTDSTGTKAAKQVLAQFGRVASGTFAAYMQKCYLSPIDPARRMSMEDSTAIELEFHGDTGGATDLATAAKKLEDAAIVIGFM